MTNIIKIIILIIILISYCYIELEVWTTENKPSYSEEVKCYDSKMNEIKGVTCSKEYNGFDYIDKWSITLITTFVFTAIALITFDVNERIEVEND